MQTRIHIFLYPPTHTRPNTRLVDGFPRGQGVNNDSWATLATMCKGLFQYWSPGHWVTAKENRRKEKRVSKKRKEREKGRKQKKNKNGNMSYMRVPPDGMLLLLFEQVIQVFKKKSQKNFKFLL
jgi:hypothetical protein